MNAPFQVRTSGVIARRKQHSTAGSKAGDVMLTVFLEGAGNYRNSKGLIRVKPNMAGLVPHEDEGVLSSDPDNPYLHYYCRFTGDYAKEYTQYILKERKGQRFFPVDNAQEIAELIRQMGKFSARKLPEHMGYREGLLAMALTLLKKRSRPHGNPPLNSGGILTYLADHLAGPTDLDAMAKHFGVSKATLCKTAKKTTGKTIQQIHQKKKMDWSKVLLSTGNMNVREVAQRIGYTDPLYFSRVFKRHFGVSPKQFN